MKTTAVLLILVLAIHMAPAAESDREADIRTEIAMLRWAVEEITEQLVDVLEAAREEPVTPSFQYVLASAIATLRGVMRVLCKDKE